MSIRLYAGKSVYPRVLAFEGVRSYTTCVSDNPLGAGNQQERLIKFLGWITGFVDGEGCFSVGFIEQPDRPHRKGYTWGYQVYHEFAVVQGAKSLHCLKKLKRFFGVGNIYINRRHDNHKEDLYRYSVVRRNDLLCTIIPFFEKHPLRTSKRLDFEKFAWCVRRMNRHYHLSRRGLIHIARVIATMNHRKPRKYLISILRDYTPNARSYRAMR